jgi:SNF2 family DNA or RNA helicase
MAVAGLHPDKELITLQCLYSQRDMLLTVPGARWDKDAQLWNVPRTWVSCLQLRGLFGQGLEVTGELEEWAWNERNTRIDPAMNARAVLDGTQITEHDATRIREYLDKVETGTDWTLKPFQVADLIFLTVTGQSLLANEPGTGKTAVALRSLQVLEAMGLDALPALVICPNSLKNTVWAEELARWAPELTVTVVGGSAPQRRKQIAERADITILNYESLRLHTRQAGYGTIKLNDEQKLPKELNEQGYRTVICDEAHRLRHAQAQVTRSAWAVLHDAEYRYLLTGTPVANHCGDLWGLLHGIRPDAFPGYTRYLQRYGLVGYNWFGGTEVLGLRPETSAEFRAVTEPFFRRVPKEAVLPQLPPKLPVAYRETPMSPGQAKAYKQMSKELLALLDGDEMISAPSALSQMIRLLQFASASMKLDERGDLKLTEPSSKVDDLVEFLEELGEEPLVVAAVSRQLIELAAARMAKLDIPHGLVTGAIPVEQRARAVTDFQEGRTRVIFLTLGAGAEGLTLTRARTMLFMQESFNPIENAQAEDRVYRLGSEIHDHVQIVKQIAPGTVEQKKRELVEAKNDRIEQILADRETLRRLLG